MTPQNTGRCKSANRNVFKKEETFTSQTGQRPIRRRAIDKRRNAFVGIQTGALLGES